MSCPLVTAAALISHFDYLHLAYTNTTAFSPTGTVPLSRRAKLLMMLQSTSSLIISIALVGRAINITT